MSLCDTCVLNSALGCAMSASIEPHNPRDKCDHYRPRHYIVDVPKENENGDHYKTASIECIDAIRAVLGEEGFQSYCRGTAMKYLWRCGKKDEQAVEMKKVAVYIRLIIESMEGKELSK